MPARLHGWIPELDGLRALAALSVVVAHFDPFPLAAENLKFYGDLRVLHQFAVPNLGVAFFFVLSSFLLTYLSIREADSSVGFSVGRFYRRRILRIFPLYFVSVAIGVVFVAPAGVLAGQSQPSPIDWRWVSDHIWMFVAFVSNWSLALTDVADGIADKTPYQLSILWSVAVEEQFYLFYPAAVLFVLARPQRFVAVAATATVIALASRIAFVVISAGTPPPGLMYFSTLSYLEMFLAGAWLGWGAARGTAAFHRVFGCLRRRGAGLLITLSLSLVGATWGAHLWPPYGGGNGVGRLLSASVAVLIYPAVAFVLAALLAWVLAHSESRFARFLRSRPLRTLGLISYGTYLWHPVAARLVQVRVSHLAAMPAERWEAISIAAFLDYVGLTLIAATLAYCAIERPFLALKPHRADAASSGRAPPDPLLALAAGLMLVAAAEAWLMLQL